MSSDFYELLAAAYISFGLLYMAWRANKATKKEIDEIKDRLKEMYEIPFPTTIIAAACALTFSAAFVFSLALWPILCVRRILISFKEKAK